MKPNRAAAPPYTSMFVAHDEMDERALNDAWKGIGARRVRARRVARAWLATPIVAMLTLLIILFVRHRDTIATPSSSSSKLDVIALANGTPLPSAWVGRAPSVANVALDDGSRLELGRDAHLRAVGHDPLRVDLVLDRGEVTFDIKPGGPRVWIIDAGGGTTVRVLGTRFTVAVGGDDHHVHVSVARGKVRVASPHMKNGTRELIAGEEVDVGVVDEGAATATASSTSTSPPPPTVRVEALADKPAAPPPLTIASATKPSPPPPPQRETTQVAAHDDEDTVNAAMIQADATRKAGRPRDAIRILSTVVDGSSGGTGTADPRAKALAAFTIGKIYVEELGDPASAATWFERAMHLGLPRGLDEDAEARIVECYGSAGRKEDAARAADRYETKFPDGRHLARVRRWKRD